MRLYCPGSGMRDIREFSYRGASLGPRPEGDWSEAWDDYLHLRDNPAGVTKELWYHTPTGTWIEVERNTVTHEVLSTRLASEAAS